MCSCAENAVGRCFGNQEPDGVRQHPCMSTSISFSCGYSCRQICLYRIYFQDAQEIRYKLYTGSRPEKCPRRKDRKGHSAALRNATNSCRVVPQTPPLPPLRVAQQCQQQSSSARKELFSYTSTLGSPSGRKAPALPLVCSIEAYSPRVSIHQCMYYDGGDGMGGTGEKVCAGWIKQHTARTSNSVLTGNHGHHHVRKPRSDGHRESFASLSGPLAARTAVQAASIRWPGPADSGD